MKSWESLSQRQKNYWKSSADVLGQSIWSVMGHCSKPLKLRSRETTADTSIIGICDSGIVEGSRWRKKMKSNISYDEFKHSACFNCGYCKEQRLPESDAELLDVRKNGVVKIWCYAANDVTWIMLGMEREQCLHWIRAENE